MVAQRRRLGAAHALDPIEVGVRDVAERRRRVGRPLESGRAVGELALDIPHEPVLGDDRGVLVEEAGPRAATAAAERTRRVRLEPGGPEPALHRLEAAVRLPVAPAGLVDGSPLRAMPTTSQEAVGGFSAGSRRDTARPNIQRPADGVALE